MQTTIFFYFKKNLHKLTLWLKMSQDTYLWLNRDDALDFPQKSKLKDLDGFGSFLINWRKLENWVSVSVYVHRTSAVNCSRFYISSAVNCRRVLSYFTCVSQPNQMCEQQISWLYVLSKSHTTSSNAICCWKNARIVWKKVRYMEHLKMRTAISSCNVRNAMKSQQISICYLTQNKEHWWMK